MLDDQHDEMICEKDLNLHGEKLYLNPDRLFSPDTAVRDIARSLYVKERKRQLKTILRLWIKHRLKVVRA